MPFRSSSIQSKLLDVEDSKSSSFFSNTTHKDKADGPTSPTKAEDGFVPRVQLLGEEGSQATEGFTKVSMVLVKLAIIAVAGILLYVLAMWIEGLWGWNGTILQLTRPGRIVWE